MNPKCSDTISVILLQKIRRRSKGNTGAIIFICIAVFVVGVVLTAIGVPASAALPISIVIIVVIIGFFIAGSVGKDKDYKETTLREHSDFLDQNLGKERVHIGHIEGCTFFKGTGNSFAYVVTDRGMGQELSANLPQGNSNVILNNCAYCRPIDANTRWKMWVVTGYSQRIASKQDMKIAGMASLFGFGLIVGPRPSNPNDNCIKGALIEVFGFSGKRFFIPVISGDFEISSETKSRLEKAERDFELMVRQHFSSNIEHYQMGLFE